MEKMGLNKMVTFTNFWRNKRVLITGHTGFKGTWLLIWLTTMGAKVAGVADIDNHSFFSEVRKELDFSHHLNDVRNLDALKKIVNEFNPEIVFHMAAQPLVIEGYKNPIKTFESNIMGTANILESLRESSGIKSIVVITTDKVYENDNTGNPLTED